MTTYMIFGLNSANLAEARVCVESALGVGMELHESDFRCGEYYRFGSANSEHFILQRNFDDEEGEWTRGEFSDFAMLLYVNDTTRGAQIESVLMSTARLLATQDL